MKYILCCGREEKPQPLYYIPIYNNTIYFYKIWVQSLSLEGLSPSTTLGLLKYFSEKQKKRKCNEVYSLDVLWNSGGLN